MDNEQRNELYKFFKLIFASKLNQDKYKDVKSYEDLDSLLEEYPEDKNIIEEELNSYTEDELLSIAEQLINQQPTMAKNGTKLEYLTKLKKGKKITKKCKCGCDLITVKESGGKLVSKCSCGCNNKK